MQHAWRKKICRLLGQFNPTFANLKKQIKDIRYVQHESGLSLVQKRIMHLEAIFDTKHEAGDLQELLDHDKNNTTFDNSQYVSELQSTIEEVY